MSRRKCKPVVMICGKGGRFWPRTCWIYPCELPTRTEMTYLWTWTKGWGAL